MSKAINDPWVPQNSIPRISMPGDLDARKLNVSSEEYIATLEAKLRRLQGKSGGAGDDRRSRREMLRSLGEARDKQPLGEALPFSSNLFPEGDDHAEAPQLSAIQKKLHPERQALTQEELKVLVDHDDLAKRVAALLDTDKEQEAGQETFPFNEYKTGSGDAAAASVVEPEHKMEKNESEQGDGSKTQETESEEATTENTKQEQEEKAET